MLATMATALNNNARLLQRGNMTNTNNRTTRRRFLPRVSSSSKGGGVFAKDDDDASLVNGFWGKPKGAFTSGGVLMSRSTLNQTKKSRGMVSLKTNASSTSSSSSAKAAAASTGDGNGFSLKTGFSTLAAGPRTAVLFSLWYFFNIVFNVYNKSTLNVFPYPWLISTLQLAATSIWMLVVWATGIQEKPKVSKAFLVAVLPVAFFHMVGHVSACVSFSKMAVSFTHVIKAAEPVFSVILSGPLLGATYSPAVWASLIPIVLGCSMAAMKEVSFSISGFNGAMISNVAMVLRNITSKKQLNDFKAVDGINLYGILGIVGLFYLAPAAVYMEGSQWAAGWSAAVAKVGAEKLCQMLFLSGVFYHLYNQVSYQALTGISPVTFSVGNSLKRVAVIVASVIYFRNPVSPLNAAGSGLALLGAYLYTKATEKKK
jgi:solute carrier family 35, member E1